MTLNGYVLTELHVDKLLLVIITRNSRFFKIVFYHEIEGTYTKIAERSPPRAVSQLSKSILMTLNGHDLTELHVDK
jgi:hypothetical protein